MKFEKKLIILSGDSFAKGTLALERNAYGLFATFSVYNLPDLNDGEYEAGIKNPSHVFLRKLGNLGRVLLRFKIEDTELDNIHCVIFDTVNKTPLLYGTSADKKLWEGNMMDGFVEKRAAKGAMTAEENLPDYAQKTASVNDFFLDIYSKTDARYSDYAVAAVNYYPKDMSIEVEYSDRGKVKEEINPIDSAYREKERAYKEQLENSAHSESAPPKDYKEEFDSDFEGMAGAKAPQEYIPDSDVDTESAAEEKTGASADTFEFEDGEEDFIVFNDKTKGSGIAKQFTQKESVFKKEIEAHTENKGFEKKIGGTKLAGSYNGAKVNKIEEVASTIPPLSQFSAENAVKNRVTEAIFYEQVKSQLDELFEKNAKFELLEKMMPDTKWVKVDYDNNGKYYVVGLIGQNPDYLCYGVPAVYSAAPPQDLSGYCQWLPLTAEKPDGEGFWLMFQDAYNGESIKD